MKKFNTLTPAAFVYNHLEPVTHFPYEEIDIDRGNPLASQMDHPSAYTIAGDGLAEVLAWCWQAGPSDMQAAFVKFISVTALLNPSLLNNETYLQLGERIGCTKAALSKVAVEFQDKWGVQFRRSRAASGRENMREARLRQVEAQRNECLKTGQD